jgi:hypothetical protein
MSLATLEDAFDLRLTSRHFMALLIVDDRKIDDERLRRFARRMFDNGAVYVCVRAPDSRRVLNLFLEVAPTYPETDDRYLMCAGREQRFEQMLWFFLYATRPAPDFAATCAERIVVTVDAPHLAAEVHRLLPEPHTERLDEIQYRDMLAEDDDWKRMSGGLDSRDDPFGPSA